MRELKFFLIFCGVILSTALFGQKVSVEGYVFEDGNRGYLNVAQVTILDADTKAMITKAITNKNGVFIAEVEPGRNYIVKVSKKVFQDKEIPISTVGKSPGESVYVKAEMSRKPGYRFEVTLAEERAKDEPVNAIEGSTIEVYNNTTDKEVMELKNHPLHTFALNFEQGNHYTIMVRKKDYFVKRMEAYVNVKGCILCFDGVGEVTPGAPNVSDVLTEENKQGTLLANVEMRRIKMNESIKIKNIYYKSGSSRLNTAARSELDKLVIMLRDNPTLLIEIGSHTDSNGDDRFNQKLSQRRAKGVVAYLETKGINSNRMIAKGYGENKLVNRCKNGVECSDRRHAKNRRTELKIVGFTSEHVSKEKSLFEIKEEERFQKMLEEVQSGEQVVIEAGEEVPDYIKNQTTAEDIEAKMKAENQQAVGDTGGGELKVKLENQNPPSPPVPQRQPESTPIPTPKKELPTKTKIDKMNQPGQVSGSTHYKRNNTSGTKPSAPATKEPKPRKIIKERIVSPATNPPAAPSTEVVEDEVFDNSNINRMQGEIKVNTGNGLRKANDLPSSYSGFKVEFFTSPYELPSSHEIFSRHGNIMKEQRKDGSYAYLLGDFKAETNAYNFLNSIIKERYPSARVIEYVSGRRIN